ncbi:acetolactate synthase, large subunit, biosynthetic type [Candidatus Epulonipiscium fishelsonii]|uniref:Acetolactate synthase, large subunit, biosynthetic type n=1 Tax=Candidatus Epulonipiscium fishelsonii TaxID=77094 RepID=A0ACC8XG98_9FIRM|nr:acetolactate synthase, large subunit, biosynthetic type [Epulopiscium sp. SCG-B05WGA-EpuloA1]ONI42655.1 acetolactate synthase, large subunit, biosynthetic type [Epulopiscium sp. SCG-B11WGA-EpuloA1]
MEYSGAKILIKCLIEQGVDTIFGYPGGSVLQIYDELDKNSDKIKHILVSHEQGAAHAADGYARATGKVGVCISTSGPGATNFVTGIATAYADSSPIVVFTGNVSVSMLGKNSFQEVDIIDITKSITKKNYIVKDVCNLEKTIKEAFFVAASGRPGPVLIDIPKDVSINKTTFPSNNLPILKVDTPVINKEEIQLAKKLIEQSERPYIYIGGGIIISGAEDELNTFAELIGAPVANSLMGIGGFNQKNPLSTGMLGMHGNIASNKGVMECDLLIAIGVRFNDRVTSNIVSFAKEAKILHIDIDQSEIGKTVNVSEQIVGDAKAILHELNSVVKPKSHIKWLEKIANWKKEQEIHCLKNTKFNAEQIMESIDHITNGDAIIVTDVGQHQLWAAQYFSYTKPRTFITSGGIGTMGFGLGASVGVSMAYPDKLVIQITGDGALRMNCNELSSVADYNLPIIMVVMNNRSLGMVRQLQHLFFEKRYFETALEGSPNFSKLAQAYDIKGYQVENIEDFNNIFIQAMKNREAVLIDCIIDREDRAFPMVAPGSPINELILK